MKSFLALLAVCVALASGEILERSFQRIVGGRPTTIEQYPFAVVQQRGTTTFSSWCGASILTRNAVLGAAHCFFLFGTELPASQFRLRVGSSQSSSGGSTYFLSNFVIHPQYNARNNDNDIAVMRTKSNIYFNSQTVAPVAIAGPNYIPPDNDTVWAIGWGATQHPSESPETLRHVQIYVVNHEECARRYGSRGYRVSRGMICSGVLDVGGKDQCQGDSGSPLLHNNVQVGVCSWGIGCADPFYPGVNARVSRYSNWIQSTVNDKMLLF